MSTPAHQLRAIALGDDPESWSALGFTLMSQLTTTWASPAGSVATGSAGVTLGHTTLVLTGEGGGFGGWAIDGLTSPIDGLSTAAPLDQGSVSIGPPHPNGISSIDHVVLATGDMDRTGAALNSAGLDCRGSRSTTSYGSPMRQAFYWLGDVILEVVGPDVGEPTTDAPSGVFGLALVSEDLDATVAYLRHDTRLGELAGNSKDAVQGGRRIAGIRGDRVGVSLPLAVMSPHPDP